MTKRLRYQVAVSLDGFIAGPNGEYDWIVMDPAVDFTALYKEFDTAVMGRKTYEVMTAQGGNGAMPGIDVVVFSRTLPEAGWNTTIMRSVDAEAIAALKSEPGGNMSLKPKDAGEGASEDAFRAFRRDNDAAYESLDRSCDALTARETRIGAYTV